MNSRYLMNERNEGHHRFDAVAPSRRLLLHKTDQVFRLGCSDRLIGPFSKLLTKKRCHDAFPVVDCARNKGNVLAQIITEVGERAISTWVFGFVHLEL